MIFEMEWQTINENEWSELRKKILNQNHRFMKVFFNLWKINYIA